MNESLLQTGDVLKLSLIDSDTDDIRAALANIAISKDVWKKYKSLTSMAAGARNIDGMKPESDIIDETIYVEHENGTQFELTRGDSEVVVKEPCSSGVYGVVVDCAGYPFIVYPLSGKVYFEPYQKLQDNIVGKYRHVFSAEQAFRMQLTHQFIMPDVISGLCDKESNISAAKSFYGNHSLNYIYLIFGLLGVPFPEEWATNGAPEEMLTDYNYGFIEVL